MKTKETKKTKEPKKLSDERLKDLKELEGYSRECYERDTCITEEINALKKRLESLRRDLKENSRIITQTTKAVTDRLKADGFSGVRITTLIKGSKDWLIDSQLQYLASDDLSESLAAEVEAAFSMNRAYKNCGLSYLTDHEIKKLVSIGIKAYCFRDVNMNFSGFTPEERKAVLCSGYSTSRICNTMVMAIAYYRYPYGTMDRLAKSPLSDEQLRALIGDNSDMKVRYKRRLISMNRTPLAEYVGARDRLTEKQLDLIAKEELPAELISVLRYGLLAGLDQDLVTKYAVPDADVSEVIQEFVLRKKEANG